MSATPESAWGRVKALLHSVYGQPDADAVHAQFDRIHGALTEKLPAVADHLEAARGDILAVTVFPKEVWRQTWSNNRNERLYRERRSRTDVVGIFLRGCLRIGSPEVTRNLTVGPHGLDPVRASPFGLSAHRWSGDLRAAC